MFHLSSDFRVKLRVQNKPVQIFGSYIIQCIQKCKSYMIMNEQFSFVNFFRLLNSVLFFCLQCMHTAVDDPSI